MSLYSVIENAGSMTGVKFTDDAADPQSLLQSAFESINNSVTREAFSEKSGSTATVVYIKGKKVYVANVGDSKAVRGVLNSSGQVQALELTADHKPVGAEKERIIERGGTCWMTTRAMERRASSTIPTRLRRCGRCKSGSVSSAQSLTGRWDPIASQVVWSMSSSLTWGRHTANARSGKRRDDDSE